MPKCPECGKEINKLYEYDKGEDKFELYVGEDGKIHRDLINYLPGNEVEYECPECQAVLFSNPGDAEKFLTESK